MNYRPLGKTGFAVSEVGIGGEYLEYEDQKTVERTIHAAMDLGVNILDVFMSEPNIRTNLGRALKGRRDRMCIQGQICSIYERGQYRRTRDFEKSKFFLDDLFQRLQTDYIDIGMLHYVDTLDDWQQAQTNGIVDYMLELKKQGRFLTLGVSSHDSAVAQELVASGVFDVLMFSINPMFDLVLGGMELGESMGDVSGRDRIDIDVGRAALYNMCEERGVGITSMKTLGAGRLLKTESSPFGIPMTVNQCIHYALTRPAVASVLIGARSVHEIEQAVAYSEATEQEKDYTGIYAQMKGRSEGTCMYCNHCLPCPRKIDVAAVTRLLDEARESGMDARLGERYGKLRHKASECILCAACEKRCPFGVQVIDNMQRAAQIFE